MTYQSASWGLVALLGSFVLGACSDGGDGDSSSGSSGSSSLSGLPVSTDPPAAVAIPDKDVPENLVLEWHYPGNSCEYPNGIKDPDGSFTHISITLLPAQQAVGIYPLCDMEEVTAWTCVYEKQCTGSGPGTGAGGGGAMPTGKLEILSMNDNEVTFSMTDVQSCNSAFIYSRSPYHDGTYTALRCK